MKNWGTLEESSSSISHLPWPPSVSLTAHTIEKYTATSMTRFVTDSSIEGGALDPPHSLAALRRCHSMHPCGALTEPTHVAVCIGIFGSTPAAAQEAPTQPKYREVTGTQGGGIFGAPIEQAITSHPGRSTQSSLDGGIFGGSGAYAQEVVRMTPRMPVDHAPAYDPQAATHPTPRLPVEKAFAPDTDAPGAGRATIKGDSLSLAWSENAAPQYQEPPLSARRSKMNAPSAEGGARSYLHAGIACFPPPPLCSNHANEMHARCVIGIFNTAPMSRPMSARRDPNASSIQGGIFG